MVQHLNEYIFTIQSAIIAMIVSCCGRCFLLPAAYFIHLQFVSIKNSANAELDSELISGRGGWFN